MNKEINLCIWEKILSLLKDVLDYFLLYAFVSAIFKGGWYAGKKTERLSGLLQN